MIAHFKKLRRIGHRRVIVYVLIRSIINLKVWFYRYFLSDNAPQVDGMKLMTPTQFIGRGSIKIKNAQLGVWPSPYFLSGGYLEARSPESSISIGTDTTINNNFTIIADRTKIEIGSKCLIGPNLFLVDSDFHGLKVEDRSNGNYKCCGVIIEDDVFIGEDVKILKGVRIGRGAIVGAGSVVSVDVKEYSIYKNH